MQSFRLLWVLCETAVFTVLAPFSVGLWIPDRIHHTCAGHFAHTSANPAAGGSVFANPAQFVLAYALLLLGAVIYMWCAWDFAAKGMGTPAPIDAPKHLVVDGLYRYVRNPMYVAVFCLVILRALFFASLPILFYLVLVVVLVNLFVRAYEEPHLRKVFGAAYLSYCRDVARWRPRFAAQSARR
jgi:protein-S-isoprenylcysteine O-methyltransferase Ste14